MLQYNALQRKSSGQGGFPGDDTGSVQPAAVELSVLTHQWSHPEITPGSNICTSTRKPQQKDTALCYHNRKWITQGWAENQEGPNT